MNIMHGIHSNPAGHRHMSIKERPWFAVLCFFALELREDRKFTSPPARIACLRKIEKAVAISGPQILGRLILIQLRCWEVLPFLTFQRQRCIKILCPKDPEIFTLLALNCQKGQHLPTLEVYKNQSPKNLVSFQGFPGKFPEKSPQNNLNRKML